jgi:hypothetical protein
MPYTAKEWAQPQPIKSTCRKVLDLPHIKRPSRKRKTADG